MSRRAVSFRLNGEEVTVDVDGDERLAAVLRGPLGLTGTKLGCEVGVCGVCTVLVDGLQRSSCLTLAAQVDGADIVTVEGVGDLPGTEHLQDAFVTEGAFQCGFCTSGQMVNAAAILATGRVPEMDAEELNEHLDGNLCRCTGYYGIVRAIVKAAR